MSDGGGWLDPAEAVSFEREGFEEGTGDAQGVGGGAEVVVEAGEGGFGGGAGAAGSWIALVHGDGDSALRQGDGGGEAVGSGADDVGGA